MPNFPEDFEAQTKDLLKRFKAAVKIAHQYAQIDGGHHKTWVIDQMLRKLLGTKEYKAFVRKYTTNGEYEWDIGIAP